MDKPVEYIHVFVLPGIAVIVFSLAFVSLAELVPAGIWRIATAIMGWSALVVGHGMLGIALVQTRQLKRRLNDNLCPNCGYDLRATPARCPECGQATKAIDHGMIEQTQKESS